MLHPLTEADLAACVEIMCTSDPWKRLGLSSDTLMARAQSALADGLSWVAELDSKLVGFAFIQSGFLGGHYLRSVAVHARYRNAGIGAQLLQKFEDQGFRQSANVFLCVSSFNTDAQRLYLRHGYQVIGEIKDFFILGEGEILMRKTLGPLQNYKVNS